MKTRFLAWVAASCLCGVNAIAADGLITLPSAFGPKETIDRLAAEVEARGMTVFARVDHAAGAAQAGLSLRPTELLVFGNAKGGTPLMQISQSVGIDLPLKALAWKDADGKVWLSYNDPSWLAKRHALGGESQAATERLAALLGAVARNATAP
ncbi:MAG TPA: DUF302 domain-containing protein [Burkholderiales bacterium]|nr:DUF302 domain-containing protein [Burkholderiales bacterium]